VPDKGEPQNNGLEQTNGGLRLVAPFAAHPDCYAPAVVSVNPAGIPATLCCGSGVNSLILKSTDPHACHHLQPATTARSVAGERVDCCDADSHFFLTPPRHNMQPHE
jgi:hypothetical protein